MRRSIFSQLLFRQWTVYALSAVLIAISFVLLIFMASVDAQANDLLTVEDQEIGISAGPIFPLRLTTAQSSKLFGEQVNLSWAMTFAEMLEKGVFEGALSLGVEGVLLHTRQPSESYNVGVMPRLRYVFGNRSVVRPYLEGGGGGIWGDLAGTPEQGTNVNFILMAGAGLSVSISPHTVVSVGYRFYHISNADLASPNGGLNYNYPFIGLSYLLH